MKSIRFLSLVSLPLISLLPTVSAAPQALEISLQQKQLLLEGREADGILGDFLLRNNLVEAIVSGNLPDRRPNMSNFYGADGITPGCLYDLGTRGKGDDQLTIFSPGGQKGRVSWVKVSKDGGPTSDGVAEIECHVSPALNRGLAVTHRYRMKDGWHGVEIETEWENTSTEKISLPVEDIRKSFSTTGIANGIIWGDAVDPADKAAYAVDVGEETVSLEPKAKKISVRFLAIGNSPLAALSRHWERNGETSAVEFTLTEADGTTPAPKARALLKIDGGHEIPLYPEENGRVAVRLKSGKYSVKFEEIGRETVSQTFEVLSGNPAKVAGKLPGQAGVKFAMKDDQGRSTPCKAMFVPLDPKAKKLNLGPNNRAHGCVDQWHSATGDFFVALPPGKYQITVARGPEYDVVRKELTVPPAARSEFAEILTRSVNTAGWISADFHNHTTQSGDNTCGVPDRLINLAAEHIEFAPTTEHNRLYDWAPELRRMGLDRHVATVPGMELTGSNEHLNAFPFLPEPGKQDQGAPKYDLDARISALTLRHWQKGDPDRYVQVNHPQLTRCFHDRDWDGVADEGFVGVGQFIDLWEVENTMDDGILQTAPFRVFKDANKPTQRKARWNGEFLWLQLLNQGHRIRGIAAADAHTVYGNGVGGWRNYYPSTSDEPATINWREITQAAKRGAGLITNGPFLEAWDANGKAFGGGEASLQADKGTLSVRVKVQTPNWVTVDRVLFLINGRQVPEALWTRKTHPEMFTPATSGVIFDQKLTLNLKQDAHVILVAYGLGQNLEKGFGTSAQHALQPCAYLNPVWLDVDGGGFKANQDDLGWPWKLFENDKGDKADINVATALKLFEAKGIKADEMGLPARGE